MLSELLPHGNLRDQGIEALAYGCPTIAGYAYRALPFWIVGGQADSVFDFLYFWESRCGASEPVQRMWILATIWEAAFDEASADVPRRVLLRPAVGIGSVDDPATKRNALYRIAEMAYKQRRYPQAVSGMREFIKVYGRIMWAGLKRNN